jgi:hypothetical protein
MTWFPDAAACTVSPAQHAVDNSGCTADTGLDRYGIEGTIPAAGSTFHTGITIVDMDALAVHFQYIVRAYFQAHSATAALIFIEFQCCDIFKIYQIIHGRPLSD